MRQHYDEEDDDEREDDVVIECNKPFLPDWFEGEHDLHHCITELGKVGFPPDKVLSVIRPRMTADEYKKVRIAIELPGTPEYAAYQSGKDAADFEMMYALHIRACSAEKGANEATDLILKLNTAQRLKSEINKRFMT